MRASLKLVPREAPPPSRTFEGDDEALVAAFRRDEPNARAALYDRHADHVHRVLYRVLGLDRDLGDLHHDVFVEAVASLPKLRDPSTLKGWLTIIALHVARKELRRRKRRSWLWFLPSEEVPEVESADAPAEVMDAARATYAVLDALPADERIAFALRYVDGMELVEVAAACGTSLATIKRRLQRAGERFATGAKRHAALQPWLEGGTRWGDPSDR